MIVKGEEFMVQKLKCDCCGTELSLSNARFVEGIERIKVCNLCQNEYVQKVKSKYYVETYKGDDIYTKDGMYYPYWDCAYCYDNLEDCRKRMDNRHIGIYIL